MLGKIRSFLEENQAAVAKIGGIAVGLTILYHYLEKPRLEEIKEKKLREISKKIFKKIYPIFAKMAIVVRRMVLPRMKKGAGPAEIETMMSMFYNHKLVLLGLRSEEIEKEGYEVFDMQLWIMNYDKRYEDINTIFEAEDMLKSLALKGKTPVVFCEKIPDFLDQELVLEIARKCTLRILGAHIHSRLQLLENELSDREKANRSFGLIMSEVEIYQECLIGLDGFKGWLDREEFVYHPLCYYESSKQSYAQECPQFANKVKLLRSFQQRSIQNIYKTDNPQDLKTLRISIKANKIFS